MFKPIAEEEVRDYFSSETEARDFCEEINDRVSGRNTALTSFATPNEAAVRQRDEDFSVENSMPPFRTDIIRVLFSKEWERLARKTQAVTSPRRDHILNRMVHSQRVGEISAYIARCIGANEQLARAIGFAHDIGHAPLGHVGEMLISDTVSCLGRDVFNDIGFFMHNIQGVNVVDRVACVMGDPKGAGLNLTDQVRHGILTHDGESDFIKVKPDRSITPEKLNDSIEKYINKVIKCSANVVIDFDMNSSNAVKNFIGEVKEAVKGVRVEPATIEACIVLLVDTLHYAPEDFDDLVALGVVDEEDLPIEVVQKLGVNSGDMINSLIVDILVNSYGKDMISYGREISETLLNFKKDFLYPRYGIVNSWVDSESLDSSQTEGPKGYMLERMKLLFDECLKALENPESYPDSSIIKGYMEGRDFVGYMEKLRNRHGENANVQAVIDYIAGFTDKYFLGLSEDMLDRERD